MAGCTICRHPKRAQIEIGLTCHTSMHSLAVRFSCSEDALQRHKANHLTPQMRAAILAARKPSEIDLEQLQRSESEGLLAQLVTQRARLQQHADLALEVGNTSGAVAAERAIITNLELVAKLLGSIVQHHSVTRTNILISADYLALRHAIVSALKPFPEAARAVARALSELEASAAKDITSRATEKAAGEFKLLPAPSGQG
jgi:hypothetical protein